MHESGGCALHRHSAGGLLRRPRVCGRRRGERCRVPLHARHTRRDGVHDGVWVTSVAFEGATVRHAATHGTLISEHDVVHAAERWLEVRPDWIPLGRDHAAWRAAFYPVRNVFEGDFVGKLHHFAPEDRTALEEKTTRTTDDAGRCIESLTDCLTD